MAPREAVAARDGRGCNSKCNCNRERKMVVRMSFLDTATNGNIKSRDCTRGIRWVILQ